MMTRWAVVLHRMRRIAIAETALCLGMMVIFAGQTGEIWAALGVAYITTSQFMTPIYGRDVKADGQPEQDVTAESAGRT